MAFFCLQSFRVPCAFPARCGVEKPDTFRRCSNTCGCARRRAGDVSGGATTFTSSTLLSLAATPPFCPRGRKVGDVGGRNKRYRESRRYDIWFSWLLAAVRRPPAAGQDLAGPAFRGSAFRREARAGLRLRFPEWLRFWFPERIWLWLAQPSRFRSSAWLRSWFRF